MSLFGDDSEATRIRFGLISLVMGVILIVWAGGNWMYRTTVSARPVSAADQLDNSTITDPVTPVAGLARLLVLGGLVLTVVLIGSFVLSRAARKYFGRQQRQRLRPTDAADTWSLGDRPDTDLIERTDREDV